VYQIFEAARLSGVPLGAVATQALVAEGNTSGAKARIFIGFERHDS
jgi:hypothetical protein